MAFLAQGLADGRERGDATRRNLVIVEADNRYVRWNGKACLVECGDDAGRDTVRTTEHAIEGDLAREELMHSLVAVPAVPAGVDNVLVREVFTQDGAVASQAVNDGGVVLRAQHGDDIFASALFHGECRKASALFIVGVDRREHIAIGMALELAAQYGGYAQFAQHFEQLAALVRGDVDDCVERAALKVLACAVALVRGRRLQDNGQIGRFRELLGNTAQELAVRGVAEQLA